MGEEGRAPPFSLIEAYRTVIESGTLLTGTTPGEKELGREDDIHFARKALEGDEEAFRRLVERYQSSVYTLCTRMTGDRDAAEDLAQEVFIRVFKNLAKYDPAYPFSSWIFKIASNLCIDHLRRRRPELLSMDAPVQGEEGDFSRQFISGEGDPEEALERQEIGRALAKAIDRLPPRYRLIILLRHQQCLSYEEIAASQDLPIGTVKARIHRARRMLRELLAEMGVRDER